MIRGRTTRVITFRQLKFHPNTDEWRHLALRSSEITGYFSIEPESWLDERPQVIRKNLRLQSANFQSVWNCLTGKFLFYVAPMNSKNRKPFRDGFTRAGSLYGFHRGY